MRRIGTGLLWVGGIVLAALMGYTIALDLGRASDPPRASGAALGDADVAVVFPEHESWAEFRNGITACARRGLIRIIEEVDDAVVIETPTHRRRVRFTFLDVRGLRETREAVAALARRPSPPVAVVGSSNTMLTAALAESLRAASWPERKEGPVLLVPWASAVLVERAEPGAGPVALLDILPERTFRFCPHNQREADLAVSALVGNDAGATLDRAYLIEDRHDPYSVDLADCFHRAIERAAPEAEVVDHADTLEFTGMSAGPDLPSPSEDALAETIWREAAKRPEGRTLWVVLPLQDQPASRMLLALRRHARPLGAAALRVVCGDGLRLETLKKLAGKTTFPVWCVSFDTPAALRGDVTGSSSEQALIPAEIVSTLAGVLDLPANDIPSPSGLREALLIRPIAAGGRGSLGRSIAFSRNGERQGDDLGHVLMIRPTVSALFETSRRGTGRWETPVPAWTRPDGGEP
jgi:hypothetical protein